MARTDEGLTLRSTSILQSTLDSAHKLLTYKGFLANTLDVHCYPCSMPAPASVTTITLPSGAMAWLIAIAMLALQGCAAPDRRVPPLPTAIDLRSPPRGDPRLGSEANPAADIVITALNFMGQPYRHGGNSVAQGFDCSGFTRHVYDTSLGFMLPRSADDQANAAGLVNVDRTDLRPGDLVFFNTLQRTFSHVGIYVGEGRFIHAPRTGSQVRLEDMRFAYWTQRYTGARRAADPAIVGDYKATLPDATY